ncbi:hypothetical protein [Streptomyces niveus]
MPSRTRIAAHRTRFRRFVFVLFFVMGISVGPERGPRYPRGYSDGA